MILTFVENIDDNYNYVISRHCTLMGNNKYDQKKLLGSGGYVFAKLTVNPFYKWMIILLFCKLDLSNINYKEI